MDSTKDIAYIRKMKFIRNIVVYEKKDFYTGETIIDERVVIKLQNKLTGESRIHMYTCFLDKWKNTSTNNVRSIADSIVPFLNYIYFELGKPTLPSISKLTFEIAADYLNIYGESRSRETVLQRLKAITHFYYFLVKKKVISSISLTSFSVYKESGRTEAVVCEDLKSLVKLPKASTVRPLHELEEFLILDFLLVALKYTPSIALGMYFQIFGGLRYGEVLNVTYSSIKTIGPNGRNGMEIILKNRFLRADLKNQPHVKKPRTQSIIAIRDLLEQLYIYHKKNYKVKNIDAVFVDNNGQAMSPTTYRNRFNSLKKHFIDELSISDDINLKLYAINLLEQKWSTHIGRGIFSNVAANNAANMVELALKRGDSTLDASLTYISNSQNIDRKIKENMDNYYSEQMQKRFNDLSTNKGGASWSLLR